MHNCFTYKVDLHKVVINNIKLMSDFHRIGPLSQFGLEDAMSNHISSPGGHAIFLRDRPSWSVHAWSLKNNELFRIGLVDRVEP